jgi:ribosomal protein S20
MMSNTAQLIALRSAILGFASKIKQISAVADNAAALEGYSLSQVVQLISGATNSTIHDVETALNAFAARTDNPNQVTKAQVGLGNLSNFAIADASQALDDTATTAYMTPQRTWEALLHFWATKVGTAPETLDTIQEIAEALQNNPDVIQALQDQVANKAKRSELNTAIATVVSQIEQLDSDAAATYATKVELANAVSALQGDLSAVTESVTTLSTAVGSKADSSALDSLAAVVATKATTAQLGALAVEVDAKANATDVTAALADLETAFNDAIALLNGGDSTPPPIGETGQWEM